MSLIKMENIILIIADRAFSYVKGYYLKDFDCEPIKENYIPAEFKKMNKSDNHCDDAEIRRFYLRFMAKMFPTYKEDFKEHINNQAKYDLGETTTF